MDINIVKSISMNIHNMSSIIIDKTAIVNITNADFIIHDKRWPVAGAVKSFSSADCVNRKVATSP